MNKILGLSILLYIIITLSRIFIPVIQQEISYNLKKVDTFTQTNIKVITPIDAEFGIIIPKVDANSSIVSNVDPYDEIEYEKAFVNGIAHVDGSDFPGQKGNIFLFSHNSTDSFKSSRLNFNFYLINKLDVGDEVRLYYKDDLYAYTVTAKEIVPRSTVEYLSDGKTDETLTLMTTYPPGTSLMRVLVKATRKL